jgi:hypothetical protein
MRVIVAPALSPVLAKAGNRTATPKKSIHSLWPDGECVLGYQDGGSEGSSPGGITGGVGRT